MARRQFVEWHTMPTPRTAKTVYIRSRPMMLLSVVSLLCWLYVLSTLVAPGKSVQ